MRRRLQLLPLLLLLLVVLAACLGNQDSLSIRPALPLWAEGSAVVATDGDGQCAMEYVFRHHVFERGTHTSEKSFFSSFAGLPSCDLDASFTLVTSDGTTFPLLLEDVERSGSWGTGFKTDFYVEGYEVPDTIDGATPTPTPSTATPTPAPAVTPVPTETPVADATPTSTPAPLTFLTYPNVSAAATSPKGALVTYDLAAFVQGGGAGLRINCVPASGAAFPIGTTRVACVAQDGERTAQSAFTVTVTDGAPVMGAWGIGLTDLVATYSDGAPRVSYPTPAASDAVDGTATVTCSPASGTGAFSFGRNTITCVATDTRGQQSEPATYSFGLESTLGAPLAPLGCPASGSGGSLPPIPMFLSGSVVLDGASAPDGTQVFVLLRNLAAGEGLTECWSTTGQVKLTAGGSFSSLIIAPPDSTAGWFPVQFYVDGYLATTDYPITSSTFRGGQSVVGITLTASSEPSTVNVVP